MKMPKMILVRLRYRSLNIKRSAHRQRPRRTRSSRPTPKLAGYHQAFIPIRVYRWLLIARSRGLLFFAQRLKCIENILRTQDSRQTKLRTAMNLSKTDRRSSANPKISIHLQKRSTSNHGARRIEIINLAEDQLHSHCCRLWFLSSNNKSHQGLILDTMHQTIHRQHATSLLLTPKKPLFFQFFAVSKVLQIVFFFSSRTR